MGRSGEAEALERARSDGLGSELRQALAGEPAYLVGGAVRDALLGRPLGDLDIAVEGDIDPVLDRLGLPAHTHERFGTASVRIEGRGVDLARTRRERYTHPGALPEVEPAPISVAVTSR
jgi:tRNA nucleotidyltransferase (CCA-adding enzyme)